MKKKIAHMQQQTLKHIPNTRPLARRFNSQHVAPISPFSYIHHDALSDVSKEQIAKQLKNLGPFPTYSNILNPQHFFQNTVLLDYVKKKPHPVSLRQLAGFGNTLTKQKIINSANFVRMELPIRLAIRIRDLQTLPFGVVNNYHLAQLYESYYHSFNAFRKIPQIQTIEENEKFCQTLSTLLDDHMFNLSHLMMGALEVSIAESLPQDELDSFMSSMMRSRISRRVIVEEHLSLSENYRKNPYAKKPPHYLGEIFQDCNAVDHFNQVFDNVKASFIERMPELKERFPALELEGDLQCHFQFMVPHLHFMLHEILKNAVEATIQTHGKDSGHTNKLPPVKVTIIDSKKEVQMRISDQGGGLSHSTLQQVFSFGKNPTLARKSLANFHQIPGLQLRSNLKVTAGGSSIISSPSTGNGVEENVYSTREKASTLQELMSRPHEHTLGMGLPTCSVYADYWNGKLSMNSLDGYGSDTSLTLRKLGYHSNVIQLDRA